jgi:hypothetical protein
MKILTSGVSTIPIAQKMAVNDAFNGSQRQQTIQARPGQGMVGVPGEYDHRKFLTGPLQNMVPVHLGNEVGVVGSIAYSTNNKQWRDVDPGRFGGFYAPAGEYEMPPLSQIVYVMNPETGEFEPTEVPTEPTIIVPPTRAVVANQSKAGPFSMRVIQDTDKW